MGWFISIMTPFCVTRQFHWPEVFFLSSCPGWWLFSKESLADEMASDQPGDRRGGFSKHTWAILKFGCVSWRLDNKETGWSRATFPLERKTLVWVQLYFLFWGGYCRGLRLKTRCLLNFVLPLHPPHKSAIWLHISISECVQKKACSSK